MAKSKKSIIFEGGIALVINVSGRIFQLAAIVFIVRFLGSEKYGELSFLLSSLALLSIVTVPGLDRYVVREVPGLLAVGKRIEANSLVRLCMLMVIVFSVVVGIIMILFNAWSSEMSGVMAFLFFLLLISRSLLLYSRMSIYAFNMRIRSIIPEVFVYPLCLFLFSASMYFALDENIINQICARYILLEPMVTDPLCRIMVYYIIAIMVALVFSFCLMGKKLLPEFVCDMRGVVKIGNVLRRSIILGAVSSVVVINLNAGVFMLGILSTPDNVGLYKAAGQLLLPVKFIASSIWIPIVRDFARLYKENKKDELQLLLSKGSEILFVSGLPILFGFFFFASPVLSIFGDGFQESSGILKILCVGQFFYISLGFVNILLIMVGKEKVVFVGTSIGAVVNLLLNIALIPKWGGVGAAVATSAGLSVSLIYITYVSVWKMGFNPIPFSRLFRGVRYY